MSVPVTYFEESKSRISANIFYRAREKLLMSAGIELGSPLEAVLRRGFSTSELAGPSKQSIYFWIKTI